MTRRGHYTAALATAAVGIALAPDVDGLLLAAGLLAGCNLPDDLEFPLNIGGLRGPTLIPHRSLTHWPWAYVAAIVAARMLLPMPWGLIAVGAALGALLHLAIDAVSPHGIPWLSPFRPIPPSHAIYRTWTLSEWRIVGPIVTVAIGAVLLRAPALQQSAKALLAVLSHRV